jgi:signal peptidase II
MTSTPAINPRDKRSSQPADLPPACAHIILEALQPNSIAIESARAQWRVAMHAVTRRAAEGLNGNIPATMVAKLVALRGVASSLFDAARYDAQMLTIIEKSALGDTSNDMYSEWMSQITRYPRLANLLATEPSFASIDLRDLATALRICSAQEVLTATPEQAVNLSVEVKPSRIPVLNMRTLRNTAQQAEGQLQNAAPVLVSLFAGACVFIIDRIVKLLIQSAGLQPDQSLLGGLVQSTFHTPNAVVGGLWGEGAAVGAELFGLVLALLIMYFWGANRKERSYAIGLGLIIGGMATNLFDRLAYGGVFNYVHLANLPVFNLAHVALFVGALMLAISLLRGQRTADMLITEEGKVVTH